MIYTFKEDKYSDIYDPNVQSGRVLRQPDKEFFNKFPEVETEDISGDRAKGYYAVIALAGYLLEKVFEKIGIESNDPYSVCEYYFTENVISNSFVPDHIKALSAAYSWFSANEVYFQDEDAEHPLNHERYGWIRDDKEHGSCICFIPDKLKNCLNTIIGPNTYEAATDEWKTEDILITKLQTKKTGAIVKLKNNQISTPGGKKLVIKIPVQQFVKHLKIEDETPKNEKPEDDNKPQTPEARQPRTATKTLSQGVKVVTSINALEKIAGISATTDNIIIANDDIEIAEILKQEGFL